MAERYGRLWKQLLADGRAFESHALSVRLYREQVRYLARWSQGVALDLGAGELTYSRIMAHHAKRVISLDIELTHLDLNLLGDGESLPFKSNSFDVVFCSEVMEHTPHPPHMMAEIARVLKQGGVLILFVPAMYYMHGEPHDYYRFTPHSLRLLAAENALAIQEEGIIGGLIIYLGMLFQNVWLLLTYNIPLVGWAAWQINRLLNRGFIWLDDRLGAQSKFPVLIYSIMRKK